MSARLGDRLPTAGRLLAVDLGEVRVGLAISDPDQIVASPVDTLAVPSGGREALVQALAAACREHAAVGVVIGYPRRLDGREGSAARAARELADALRDETGLAVTLRDERLTTVEAERVMLAQDASRSERRRAIDRVAAAVLLQGVLESQRSR